MFGSVFRGRDAEVGSAVELLMGRPFSKTILGIENEMRKRKEAKSDARNPKAGAEEEELFFLDALEVVIARTLAAHTENDGRTAAEILVIPPFASLYRLANILEQGHDFRVEITDDQNLLQKAYNEFLIAKHALEKREDPVKALNNRQATPGGAAVKINSLRTWRN
ncbi:hypothetical protein H6802_01155 [Candidatus Nomurabacteria bacterium]|uniref:Uncharacterized protein n=1 Tax=candidate division WWE3 bacterium TaxID=2053526 RepID=A0A955E0E9_UNCKA|nr:hypothetical protein [candidate division WWE3 bacterium]MCB9823550.1 hypothetical protein [Candidatus Nomurabacteria bacterium]MCB9827345.1 hypothetical protein [Candidatus Nomurabacteria bacterium]HXK52501.1 hypothetical protein [bacterium]